VLEFPLSLLAIAHPLLALCNRALGARIDF
jgi:hypothetical protein